MDLCRRYFFECVQPIINEKYSSVKDYYSCALIGWGSDVLQNDDEYSRDHEWGPRLLIFVDDEHRYIIQELTDILNKYIPFDFLGFNTRFVCDEIGIRIPSSTNKGVTLIDFFTYDEYIENFIGVLAPKSESDWLWILENRLFEITRGEIFYDANDILKTKLQVYKNYYPLNVWKYRMAYCWLNIGWNVDVIGLLYARNNIISAKIAVYKTLIPLIKLISLYNKKYSTCYIKHIEKEFYKLPHISNETGFLLEECFKTDDMLKIKNNLETIIEKIMIYHNSLSELPNIYVEKPLYRRGFWDIDCEKIADTIYDSIQGELKNIPLHGAADQFITNEDFLTSPEWIKKLNNIYNI